MPNPNYKYEDGKIKIKIDGVWIEPKFERYENIEPIGEPGANGVVVKGTHKVTKRKDAIKIWLPQMRNGKDEIREEQYLAEVQKIAKMKDPRIATIHDAWTENGCRCCSMEYINGITYEKWLNINHNMTKRIDMLIKIFEAIVFYQSQGIIHGDIHSRNILIEDNEKIHIIDFGTSSLSAYKEQSNHRENFLMYELVEKTLEKQFDNNVFLYKKYNLQRKTKNSDDIRNVVPIFLAESILYYLYLKNMLDNLNDITNHPQILYEYCSYIAKGSYLNMDYFYLNMPGKSDKKMELFSDTMYICLEDVTYGGCQDDIDEAEKMEFISLFAYYEEVKKIMISGKLKEGILGKRISNRCINNPNEIINIIKKTKDLFEFHDKLLEIMDDYSEIYLIETELRTALFELIKEIYESYFLHVLRQLNLRTKELKRIPELYNRIIGLSYIYCLNKGIDYPTNIS